MSGFFSKTDGQSKKLIGGKFQSCASCGLLDRTRKQGQTIGDKNRGIVHLFASPSDYLTNIDFLSFYKKEFEKFGISLIKDCICMSAVLCPCKKVGEKHIESCRPLIIEKIKKISPKIIFLHGMEAVQSLIGHRWEKSMGDISKWRGWVIPDQEIGCYIVPLFSPNFLLNSGGKSGEFSVWRNDIKRAISYLEKNLFMKRGNDESGLKLLIQDDNEALRTYIKQVVTKKYETAFDYETTGKKPQAKGHRIVSVSIYCKELGGIAFLLNEGTKRIFSFYLKSDTPKTAHNMKFEYMWSVVCLGIAPSFSFDTMISSHQLDNREGVTGLKFQTYVRIGVIGYEKDMQEYMESKKSEGSNAFNRIEELLKSKEGIKKLLLYNALDSLYQYELKKIHAKEIGYEGFAG